MTNHGPSPSRPSPPPAYVDFCGEIKPIDRSPFTIGRHADLSIDDNPFLHRRLLVLTAEQGWWMLTNVGRRLAATVADPDGRLEAVLAPGAALPLVAPNSLIRFSAGSTSYELAIRFAHPLPVRPVPILADPTGCDATAVPAALTPDQLRMLVALAEPVLRGLGRGATALPNTGEAARRLGWTTTKFNRKLDNVCDKLSRQGVRGLHGDPGRLASQRRARLVEYALSCRLITRDDLRLLPA